MRETLILFNAGVPVTEIASLKKIKTLTVYGHIAQLISDGLISSYGSILTRKQYEAVIEAYKSNSLAALDESFQGGIIPVALAIGRANGAIE